MELQLTPPCSSLPGLSAPKAGVRACLCMELGLPKNLRLCCRVGKWGRAWSWAVAQPDRLQIPVGALVLLSNLECDRFVSRAALGAARSFFRVKPFSPGLFWGFWCSEQFWLSWAWMHCRQPHCQCSVLCSIPKPLELGAGSQLMLKYPTAATQATNPSGNGTVLQLWWWNWFLSCYTGKDSMTLWKVKECHRASQGDELGTFDRRETLLCFKPQTLPWLASSQFSACSSGR